MFDKKKPDFYGGLAFLCLYVFKNEKLIVIIARYGILLEEKLDTIAKLTKQ